MSDREMDTTPSLDRYLTRTLRRFRHIHFPELMQIVSGPVGAS